MYHFVVFFLMFLSGLVFVMLGFPGGSVVKNLLANVGDMGSIPGLGRGPTSLGACTLGQQL